MSVALLHKPPVSCGANALLRCKTNGIHRLPGRSAEFDFDKGDETAFSGNNVDFSHRSAVAQGNDSIALQAKKQRGE